MLEIEGTMPNYVYIILKGSLILFKRPSAMYDKYGKLIKLSEIELQPDPKDSGNAKIGQAMTILTQGLVCEDAVVFR